ncbi:hypothetical protein FSW04_13840 [Baekduia soli]|uniref:Uncharacterized protein n=1 Tax=Baekduia soli TaxID=496014 RepID=A0A5B8U6B1_9ACTN|nr:hypothetical protein [Baekduia soli]QEC48540.1 hypothetical protein FSW04_13840 [Baekduia soli]
MADPAPDDEQLLKHAELAGFNVTPRRLAGFRRAQAMPSTPTSQCPERLVGLCHFLARTGEFRRRPDLPERRRLADAPVWLWYQGYPVPYLEVRDRAQHYLEHVDRGLRELREAERRLHPDHEPYEYATAAAEAYADAVMPTPMMRGIIPAFIDNYVRQADGEEPHVPASRHELARQAAVDLFVRFQGVGHVPNEKAAEFVLAPLVIAKVQAEVPDVEAVLAAMSLSGMNKALWHRSEHEWWMVRHLVHAGLGITHQLATQPGDRGVHQLARLSTPGIDTQGLLLMISWVASALPYIVGYLNDNPLEIPDERFRSSPLPRNKLR